MGEADIANQQWAAFTTLWSKNCRYWKSLFHWLLDVALVNSYLLARALRRSVIEVHNSCHNHQQFQEAVTKILMTYCKAPEHNQTLRLSRIYCVYCQNNQLSWQPKHQQRAFGTDITNIGGQFRGSRTQWGCDQCNVTLCKTGDCWDLWHENQGLS